MSHDTLITCLAIAVFPVLYFIGRKRRANAKRAVAGVDGLDKPLLHWNSQDTFRVRDLLRSFCVLGASGSGKSSAVALQLARALLADRRGIVLHIVGSKPEDREWWQQRFAEAGRAAELRIVAPDSGMHCNMLNEELKAGADDREIASILMTSGETLRRADATVGGGGENDQFFRDATERQIEMTVLPLRLATGRVWASDMQRFISGAAMKPEKIWEQNWREEFHWKTLESANESAQTDIEKADMERCMEYWLGEMPNLSDRTRSSITTQVMNLLHVMGSGLVRQMISSDTTLSPAMMDDGVSIFVDMPGARHGASGQFVNAMWRLGVQRHVLRRHAKPGDRIIVQWIDEFQNHACSMDSRYLAESRSHLGCQVVLTQSLHAFYAALKGGKTGEHQADALLTNYGTKCFCALGDAKTAEFAASLVGKTLQTFIGGSMAPMENLYDELIGRSKYTGSFSQHYENVLQANTFMSGLRTGGANNGYVVDGIVIRSGETFSNGSNWLRVAFEQK